MREQGEKKSEGKKMSKQEKGKGKRGYSLIESEGKKMNERET